MSRRLRWCEEMFVQRRRAFPWKHRPRPRGQWQMTDKGWLGSSFYICSDTHLSTIPTLTPSFLFVRCLCESDLTLVRSDTAERFRLYHRWCRSYTQFFITRDNFKRSTYSYVLFKLSALYSNLIAFSSNEQSKF